MKGKAHLAQRNLLPVGSLAKELGGLREGMSRGLRWALWFFIIGVCFALAVRGILTILQAHGIYLPTSWLILIYGVLFPAIAAGVEDAESRTELVFWIVYLTLLNGVVYGIVGLILERLTVRFSKSSPSARH